MTTNFPPTHPPPTQTDRMGGGHYFCASGVLDLTTYSIPAVKALHLVWVSILFFSFFLFLLVGGELLHNIVVVLLLPIK